jgi:hypothetical protein
MHSEELLDEFYHHLSRLSLQSQRQSLERSSLALRMDGLRSMFSVLERIKEEYYNARKVEGCELEARVDLWLEMGHTLKKSMLA